MCCVPREGTVAVLPGKLSTEPGSDPNPAVLARSVPSQVTPVPHCPFPHLLPSQLPVDPGNASSVPMALPGAPSLELAVSPPKIQLRPCPLGVWRSCGAGGAWLGASLCSFPSTALGEAVVWQKQLEHPLRLPAGRASLRVRSRAERAGVTLGGRCCVLPALQPAWREPAKGPASFVLVELSPRGIKWLS